MPSKRPPLDEQKSLWEATIAAEGVTTAPGAAAGNSFIDAGLIAAGANSFISMLAVVYPGEPLIVDSMDITGFSILNGEVTLASAYKGVAAPIPAGVPYKIVTFRFVPAEVAAIEAKLDLPAPNAILNTRIAEIVGNKADAAVGVVGVVASIIAYVKGILNTIAALPLVGILHEQADVIVNTTAPAAPAENNVLNLAVAGTRYIVRHLRLKFADPGANTVTVRLYELGTEVDSFNITGGGAGVGNWETHHSLMDMWGLPHLAGANLRVTVQVNAGADVAVTGQYSWASAT